MGVPKALGIGGVFRQFRGAASDVAAGDRPMPENVAQSVAELVADFGNSLVRGPTVRAGIAAIFHQRNRRVRGAESVIEAVVDRAVQAIAHMCSRHAVSSSCSCVRLWIEEPHLTFSIAGIKAKRTPVKAPGPFFAPAAISRYIYQSIADPAPRLDTISAED